MTLTWQVWHPEEHLFPFLFAVEVFSIKNAKSLCAFFVSVCSVQHTGQRGPLRRIEVRLALMIPYFMKSKNRKVDIKTLCLQLLFVHVINLLFKVGNFFSSFFLVPPPPPFFFLALRRSVVSCRWDRCYIQHTEGPVQQNQRKCVSL